MTPAIRPNCVDGAEIAQQRVPTEHDAERNSRPQSEIRDRHRPFQQPASEGHASDERQDTHAVPPFEEFTLQTPPECSLVPSSASVGALATTSRSSRVVHLCHDRGSHSSKFGSVVVQADKLP